MKRFLEMGRIGKAHGVKGEADLIWHGETAPEKGMEIFLEDASGLLPSPQIIRSLRRSNGRIFVAFEGVEDRTAVEKLRGKKVFADRETLPPLKEGEAYLADLPGWKVFLEDGEYLGKIERIEFPAGREIWAIADEGGNEILFPADPAFIVAYEPAKGEVRLNPPPGLLEIYRA